MIINFEKLQEVSKYIQLKDDAKLCAYMNSFNGDNTIEKFQTFLEAWEYHVRYDIEFNVGKSLKVPISRIIDSLPEYKEEWVEVGEYKILIGPPNKHYFGELDLLHNIKRIYVDDGQYIGDFSQLGNVLPAEIYNKLLNAIISSKQYSINYNNKALKDAEISFIGSQPASFIKGMLSGFSKEYFQDIIFSLSKRISGEILMKSDIRDIEYYIQKFNEEVQSGDPSFAIA